MPIIDAIKTLGKMSLPWRGNKDDSGYQAIAWEATNHVGVDNFLEICQFAVRQGN